MNVESYGGSVVGSDCIIEAGRFQACKIPLDLVYLRKESL